MAASCACEKCRATRSCLISHTSVATSLPLAAGALDAMPFLKVMKKFTKISYARLSPLAKGRIIGMREKGAKREDIRTEVKKTDGSSPSLLTVDLVLDRFKKDPEWDGCEKRTAGGRPRDVTEEQLAEIHKILLRDVGKHLVSDYAHAQ